MLLPTPTSTLEHPTNMKNDQPNSNLRSFTTLRGATGMLAVAGLLAMIHAGFFGPGDAADKGTITWFIAM